MSTPENAFIFVDGENFRQTLIDLKLLEDEDYFPENFGWSPFFHQLVRDKFSNHFRPYRCQRVYWYVPERAEFKGKGYDNNNINVKEIIEKIEAHQKTQDDICERSARIEFRRAGVVQYRVEKKKVEKIREKGVDVKLATDMVDKIDLFDLAILISGDSDFAPALQAVKDRGKVVGCVQFLDRKNDILPRFSKKLIRTADISKNISFEEIKKALFPK